MNTKDDYNHLKKWLRPRIKEAGWTFQKFAEEVGITRAALYFYFDDINRPTPKVIERMCALLEVPIEEGMAQVTQRSPGRPAGGTSKKRRIIKKKPVRVIEKLDFVARIMAERERQRLLKESVPNTDNI
jgi:transcriptional regulator with XRE-family HTH domain